MINYYKLVDTVYVFNASNCTVFEYSLSDNGFNYSMFCYSLAAFTTYLDMLKINKLTKVLNENDFINYANELVDLESYANTAHPIKSFEAQIQEIRDRYHIHMKHL